ncbi:hypothetical protein FQN50_005072 [Emmonsiellopsis sp. PD_5]|nr:hypothetical protein FQN50_005072 [Emmonsiellopsis sp. PD_5]
MRRNSTLAGGGRKINEHVVESSIPNPITQRRQPPTTSFGTAQYRQGTFARLIDAPVPVVAARVALNAS